MENVFEDFIFGFIDREIDEIQAKAQDTTTYLDNSKAFQLKPDLLLDIVGKKVITDTKYKILVYSYQADPSNGAQSDIYQMISYGIRFKINDIVLLYPNTIKGDLLKISEIDVMDEFAEDVQINIKAIQVSIINRELFYDFDSSAHKTISELFDGTKLALIGRIREIYF